MKLTVVGMAGSFPSPSSPASCYLLQAPDETGRTWSLVLDMGSGALGALQSMIDPFEVDAVAISHLHPDHFADLCGFYVYRKYHPVHGSARTGAARPCPVLGPEPTGARVGSAYGLGPGESMGAELEFRVWEPGTVTRVGPFAIEPFAMRHPVPAFGVRIDGPSSLVPGTRVTLAYTGDTDVCDGLTALADSADLLLAEAAFVEGRDDLEGIHLTGRRAGQVAAAAGVGRMLLTHVPVWNDAAVSVAEAVEVYRGPVDVVEQSASYLV